MHIIETIDREKGVVTTSDYGPDDSFITRKRMTEPRSGDIIKFWSDDNQGDSYALDMHNARNYEQRKMQTLDEMKYPYLEHYGQYGRIDEGANDNGWSKVGEVHTCVGMGSAFLLPSGRVSISGGPFTCIWSWDLIPAMRLHSARYWNWGNNSAGAGQGVDYTIERPLFLLTVPA